MVRILCQQKHVKIDFGDVDNERSRSVFTTNYLFTYHQVIVRP